MNDEQTFVGRRHELDLLAAALAQAEQGHGSMWLVTGDPGVGKSTLVTRFAEQATSAGVRVVWGRSRILQGAPSYWPWTQLLRPLVQGQVGVPASAADRELLAHIVPLPGESMPRSHSLTADRNRFYLFDAVARLLRTAARQRPLVLILEDLHAADIPSLLLAGFLAAELTAARVLLIATSRQLAAASLSPAGHESVSSLDALQSARRLLLPGLSKPEVAQLLRRWRLPEETVSTVWERTSGNPFLATETALSIVTHQSSDQGIAPQVVLPDGVRQVLLERWSRLTPPTQKVLAVAAVTGTQFPLGVIALCCDLPTDQAASAVREGIDLGLLARPAVDLGLYRFSHDLLRETIAAELTPERRMQMHGKVGTALVQWYGASADEHLDELARHFLAAAPVGFHQEAVDFAIRAGRHAMSKLAYEQAGDFFERALPLMRALPHPDARTEGELLISTGHALLRSGRADDAKEAFLAAAKLPEREQFPDVMAEAALGYGGQWTFTGETTDTVLVRILEDALAGLEAGQYPALRVRLLSRLAVELYHSSEWERSVEYSASAVEMARNLDDPAALGFALLARLFILWRPSSPHHLPERLVLDAEVLQLAASTRNAELEMDGRAWRITDLLESGDLVGADEQIAAFTALASSLRQPFYLWFVKVFAAMRALMRGEYASAQERAYEALDIGRRAQGQRELQENAVGAHVIQTLLIRREHGTSQPRSGAKPTPVGAILDRFPRQPAWRAAVALRMLTTGEEAQAKAHWDVLAADRFRNLLTGETSLIALALTAELTATFGDRSQIDHLHRFLAPFAGRHIVIGHPASAYQGCVDFYLGLLAAANGNSDAAVSHLEQASRLHATMGAAPWVARSQYHIAQVRHHRNAAGDAEAANHLLDSVERIGEELHMTPLTAGVDALRREIAGNATLVDQLSAPAVFARDGDIWTVQLGREVTRVRDTKGMHYLQLLLSQAGRELHVIDLAGSIASHSMSVSGAMGEGLRPDTGDAGPMLDEQAKRAYRARLQQLRADQAEAEDIGHSERAALVREEIDALAHELARAVGLGGRDRRAASQAERARVNVSRAIRTAIDRIKEHAPSLGHHLDTTVRTGVYCVYSPDPRVPRHWVVTLDEHRSVVSNAASI